MSYSPAHTRLTLRVDSHCFLTGVTAICNTVWQAIIPFINSHLLLSRRHTRSLSYMQRIHSVKHCWDQTVRPLIAHTTCAPHKRPLPTPTIKGQTAGQLSFCLVQQWQPGSGKRGRERLRFHWLRVAQYVSKKVATLSKQAPHAASLNSTYVSKCCRLLCMHHLCALQCFYFYHIKSEGEYCSPSSPPNLLSSPNWLRSFSTLRSSSLFLSKLKSWASQ